MANRQFLANFPRSATRKSPTYSSGSGLPSLRILSTTQLESQGEMSRLLDVSLESTLMFSSNSIGRIVFTPPAASLEYREGRGQGSNPLVSGRICGENML